MLPFELRWTAQGVDGSYAVFFDQPPMRPGQTLRSLVPDDDPCRAEASCPTAEWLSARQIFLTDAASLQIERLPDRRTNDRTADRHELVIVLLDQSGRRVGESAFRREFTVEREG